MALVLISCILLLVICIIFPVDQDHDQTYFVVTTHQLGTTDIDVLQMLFYDQWVLNQLKPIIW